MEQETISEQEYDIVLYGATGFVGRRAAQYLAQHPDRSKLRWAIAGRDRSKLEQVRSHLDPSVSVLVADSQDRGVVEAMVSKTRVLLNTAGPFALYGNAIVDACVRFKTHYADITGETAWIKGLIDRHHAQASADGTRIIPFCGFDSIPADLGSYLIARYMQEELGIPCQEVKAYYQMSGGFNGGTIASNTYRYESGQIELGRDPFLLNPNSIHTPDEVEQNRDPITETFDPALGTWVGPFLMGAVNTRVVRRSAALFEQWGEPYSRQFYYQEYAKYDPPLAQLKAMFVTKFLSLFEATLERPLTRRLLQPVLPKPGTGPSEKTMDSGWFITEFLGTAVDGQKVKELIKFPGDPGNRATVCFVCESALSLALDTESLPGGSQRGGILTPATGLGDVLIRRLRHAGLVIEVDRVISTIDSMRYE